MPSIHVLTLAEIWWENLFPTAETSQGQQHSGVRQQMCPLLLVCVSAAWPAKTNPNKIPTVWHPASTPRSHTNQFDGLVQDCSISSALALEIVAVLHLTIELLLSHSNYKIQLENNSPEETKNKEKCHSLVDENVNDLEYKQGLVPRNVI